MGRYFAFAVGVAWLASLYAWGSNAVLAIYYDGHDGPALMLALVVGMSIILYYAEGMELAVADLHDKEPVQIDGGLTINDDVTRETLRQIQERHDFFISQRQVFVVLIISLSTLLAEYYITSLRIAAWGVVSDLTITDHAIVGTINFIFVNVLVLCFSQVASKRLAILNSAKFLGESRGLWRLVKAIGWFNLPGPSDRVTEVIKKALHYEKRKLRPSRAAHFNTTALIHGYCTHTRSIALVLHPDGSADVTLTNLVIFLHGRRRAVSGLNKAGPADVRYLSKMDLLGAWEMPALEDLRSYEDRLNDIFEECRSKGTVTQSCERHKFRTLDLSRRHTSEVATVQSPAGGPDWKLEFLDAMPEGVRSGDDRMICIAYRVQGTAPPGSFYVGRPDEWTDKITSPCKTLHFSVEGASDDIQIALGQCDVRLDAAALPEESDRASRLLAKKSEIAYPIQSATYVIGWRSLICDAPTTPPAQTGCGSADLSPTAGNR